MTLSRPEFFKKKSLISFFLLPISIIYFIFSKLFCLFFLNQKIKIKPKVICIGNIITGGSGKTEIVKAIANAILKEGKNVAILTKGYGRKIKKNFYFKKEELSKTNPLEIGDEPYTLLKYFDIFILNKRLDLLKYKEELDHYDFIIMDDGFHDNSIFSLFKILVFDSEYFIGNGMLIPSGPMRDLFINVRKADAVILTNFSEENEKSKKNLKKLRSYFKKEVFFSKAEIKNENLIEKDKASVVFSGLGDNEKFFKFLRNKKFNIIKTFSFPDHYNYKEKDIKRLEKEIKNINGFGLTTEKDFVKIKNKCNKDLIKFIEIETKIDKLENLIESIFKKNG